MPRGLLFDDTGYERATVLPMRQNVETGRLEWAIPGMFVSPFQAWTRSVDAARAGRQIDPLDALEAAGAGVTGGLLAGAPRGALGAGPTRVSTRFPTAKGASEDPLSGKLTIGLREMEASPTFDHNVSLLSEYPGFSRLKHLPPGEAARRYIDQAADNMVYLYENSPAVMKERSPHWYDGAHEFSQALSRRHGVPSQSSSAAIAALSPQKNWDQNASLAERVGDIVTGPAMSRPATSEMIATGRGIQALQSETNSDLLRRLEGKSFSQLSDPAEQALWVRLYDEAHNPRNYRILSPEGGLGDFARNADGTPSKVAWGSLNEVAKAIQAYGSGGDMNVISPLLGTKHKVRNFHNNIEVPNDRLFGDVTADTHQVAAGHLRPLSGSSPAVAHNLATGIPTAAQPPGYRGAVSSSVDGVQGTYGLLADATRQASDRLGLLPRQAQSATWEPIRELFTPEFKTPANAAVVDSIWRAYDQGHIGIDEARRRILGYAGGIGTPSWAEPGARWVPPSRGSTYR